MDFFLLVPLDLLAAVTVADLVNRRVPVRTLIFLAPARPCPWPGGPAKTCKGAIDDLMHGRADAATALGLHLALISSCSRSGSPAGLTIGPVVVTIVSACVAGVFPAHDPCVTIGTGLQEVVFRHSETHDLLTLRTMILRRNRERPFDQLAVVGPEDVTAAPALPPHPGRAPGSNTLEAGCGSFSAPRSRTCRNAT